MSEITPSTLISSRSPLFSDSDPQVPQSGSEIVTSDEEPDLGAFTTVLRAWGHLQPPLRIPHFQSSSSSRTRSTSTTITGYPGFGGGDEDTIEESTVWNRIPIQSYFHSSGRLTTTASLTERGIEFEEADGSYFPWSPAPSPTSDSARTVEIASETDAASLHEFASYEDGASGERLVVQVLTPPSIDARTVSVGSAGESHDDQTQLSPRPSVPPTLPISYGPHMAVVNDMSLARESSTSLTSSHSRSSSNQPIDDNSTISLSRAYDSTLSIISYRPEITTDATQSSVFQESPSPLLVRDIPYRETQTTTSSSPTLPAALSRSTIGRTTVSGFSHAESDIINSYYAQRPSGSSSTDQPASTSPWSRRLEIIAQPQPISHPQPLVEHDSPSEHHRRTPPIIDDNSSASVIPEDSPPPSATTSTALSVSHELVTTNSESSEIHSSHSLTPSHTFALPATSTVTLQHSLESSTVLPYPSLSSIHREQRTCRESNPTTLYPMQQASSHPRYHLLLPERDPGDDQPSLGYLDEALSFIAAERARWTAAREAGLRGNSPQREDGLQEGDDVVREEGTRRYTTGDYYPFLA